MSKTFREQQMNDRKEGLAARLLHGAKDLVWQDETSLRGQQNSGFTTVEKPMLDMTDAPQDTSIRNSQPANAMTKELLMLVMERPTAYSALKEAIDALAELPMDEATRYRSAFAVLKKTQQRTVEQVVQAITTHLDVLATEQTRFAGQSRSAEDDEINARIAEVKALNSAVTQGRQQIENIRKETELRIQKINEDLEHKQGRSAELEREADMRKRAIEKTIQDFSIAASAVKANLEADQQRVARHLGAST
jgi:vacuolar-type H+-ATPase subunit I/STV1